MPQSHAEFVRLMDIALQYTLLHSGAEHSLPSRTLIRCHGVHRIASLMPPVFACPGGQARAARLHLRKCRRTVSREENQNQEKEKGENKHG